jgi:hypothetical protein
MNKRGDSQLDWIMSLALFLLYIIWFFAFISPTISSSGNNDPLIYLLKTNFEKEFEGRIIRYPIFIEYNETPVFLPIFLNYTSNNSDIRFSDDTQYLIWNNKLIFLGNLSEQRKTMWVVEDNDYNLTYVFNELNVMPQRVTNQNLTLRLSDSLPDSISYRADEKIYDITYKINGAEFAPRNTSYHDVGFAAIYQASTQNINHTTFVFAYSPEIYNFITKENINSNYTFSLDLELDNFPNYYSDNNLYGNFSYGNATQSFNYSYDSITLYSGTAGMTMFFDSDVMFNFTSYNDTLTMEVIFPVSSLYEYRYYFHKGSYRYGYKRDANVRIGAIEKSEGILPDNITSTYSYLKDKWNFPNEKEFNIRLYSNTTAYSGQDTFPIKEIGPETPIKKNLQAATENYYALDENGEIYPIHVNFKVW